MSTIYDEAAIDLAEAFVEDADAKKIPIKRRKASTFDPITKKESGFSNMSGYIYGIRVAASKSIAFYEKKYHEDLISGRAISLLVPAANASFEPEEEDQINFNGEQWRCFGVTPVNPTGTAILYRAGFMRQ